jgi:hypothetical protein
MPCRHFAAAIIFDFHYFRRLCHTPLLPMPIVPARRHFRADATLMYAFDYYLALIRHCCRRYYYAFAITLFRH